MKKISFKRMGLWPLALAVASMWIFGACSSSGASLPAVSTLTRPTAMAIAILDYEPSISEIETALIDPGSYLSCLDDTKRAFGFVTNSSNDSVARIDLCTGQVVSTKIKGNPFVVSHIPVGRFPVDVAVSVDEANSRVFVANGAESSLSVIVSAEGITLQDKVTLSSHPSRVVVVPSQSGVAEGDVYVTLPEIGRVARVVKQSGGEREMWAEDQLATLTTTLTPTPLPGGMAVDPAGRYLYVADMASDYFYILDLQAPEYPARVRNVYGAQRTCKVSPDGRFLYLARLDERKLAVYDLENDEYVDTNEELPSHFNRPPPGDGIDYDIELQAIARDVVFVDVAKSVAVSTEDGDVADGDADLVDGDMDAEFDGEADSERDAESDGDSDTEDDAEGSEEEAEASARLMQDCADGDVDCDVADGDADLEQVELEKALYAYTIGFNGNVQVIDVHDNLHELFDTLPDTPPELGLIESSEFEIDNGMCLADIDASLIKGRAPEARWELQYNAIIPESDGSVSGQFDFAADRLYDPNVDFTAFDELLSADMIPDPEADGAPRPDWLEITTRPSRTGSERLGCTEEVVGENGETVLQELTTVRLEILAVTAEYIEYDPRGIDLARCFSTAVGYQLRSNGNYLVTKTPVDSAGNRLGPPEYQGRAVNTPFRNGQVISGEDQLEAMSFERDNWDDYLCTFETSNSMGDTVYEFVFRTDMSLANGERVNGIRCQSGLSDGSAYWVSFENDEIAFSICQDETATDIQQKQLGNFVYAFRTFSGINEIVLEVDDDEYVDTFVGTNLETAVVMDFYPGFPRLYIVDSAEEIVYVVDLNTDMVVSTIQ